MRPRLESCERFFWRSLPLNHQTGSDIFAALFQPQIAGEGIEAIATLLESPYPLPPDSLPEAASEMARYSICAGAPRVVAGKAQMWTPELGSVLPLLTELCHACAPQRSEQLSHPPSAQSSDDPLQPGHDLPFVGGWLGWLGYDCAWEIERLPWLKEDMLPFPVAFWYEPAEFAVLDHQQQRLWLAGESPERLAKLAVTLQKSVHPSSALLCRDAPCGDPIYSDPPYIDKKMQAQSLHFETERTAFEQSVTQAKAHIRAGDVFQVNHSLRFQAQTALPSWEVYKRLHTINPSPFASYWHTPWGAVVSCSPERLVHLKDGKAQSRPIAGTRPRGKTKAADETAALALKGDRKERAEHIMLVDLERNDLGRVCEWGSVQVEELMTIERYSHVMHLVSNVAGQLDDRYSASQLVAALFPGGTITGCPKVRCMEIIEALEPVRRSLFYGSCGYLDRRGRLDLNILIRTLLMAEGRVWGQVGAGIVADSEPAREWQESLQKAKAQLLALGL